MSLPTAYTDAELIAFMLADLGEVATTIGWDAATPALTAAVNRTLRLLGLTDIAEATDMTALEAVALWQAWDAVVTALTLRYDISTDGQSLSRSQMFEHALKQRTTAQMAALGHTATYSLVATPVVYTNDPYRVIEEEC